MALIGKLLIRILINRRSIKKKVIAGIKLNKPTNEPASKCKNAAMHISFFPVVWDIESAKESLMKETGIPYSSTP